MINYRIRSLASIFICSLMFHASLAAVSAPSKEDFNRFKSMLLDKAKMVPGAAALRARDMATMWRYGVKKVTGKTITAQEKEKFDLALKRTGLPVAVVVGVIGTVLASAKLYNKYMRSRPKPVSDEEWVGKNVTAAETEKAKVSAMKDLERFLGYDKRELTQSEIQQFLDAGIRGDQEIGYYKRTLFGQAIKQCDAALVHFCSSGVLRWIQN